MEILYQSLKESKETEFDRVDRCPVKKGEDITSWLVSTKKFCVGLEGGCKLELGQVDSSIDEKEEKRVLVKGYDGCA